MRVDAIIIVTVYNPQMAHIANYVMLKTMRTKKAFLATSFFTTVPKYSLIAYLKS